MTVTLLIPVLNEIEGLKHTMRQIKLEWVDQILFVDGGSTDGTIEWLKENKYEYIIQVGKGMRNAYKSAYPLIRGDYVLTFSPDGNSIADYIPQLIDKMKEGYDMVICSRYKDGAVSYDDDKITGFGNWLFTWLINKLHGGQYTDAMVIYRIYKKSIMKAMLDDNEAFKIERFFRTNISIEPLMSIRCAKHKLKVEEIGADEPNRIGGERKLRIFKWGASYLYQIISEKFK